MRIQSPLNNLREALVEVKESAAIYKTSLLAKEDATRAALIDPLLRALGWNISNPNMVEVEKTLNSIKSSRVDYALYDVNHTIVSIVEAKPLGVGQALSSHAQQLVQYAYAFGVTSLFLTNGLVWHHYTDFSPHNFLPTRTFDLASDDLVEVAAFLVQKLDAANFWPEQPDVNVVAQEVEQLRSDLSTLQQQFVHHIAGVPPPPPPPPPPDNQWIVLTDVVNATRTRPSALRLPDKSQPPKIKYWKDVLVETCKFVLAHEKNIPIPLVDRSGMSVNLIDTNPPAKGISSISTEYNGQTVYIHTNYSAENHIANALYICQKLTSSYSGVKPAVVYKPSAGASQ